MAPTVHRFPPKYQLLLLCRFLTSPLHRALPLISLSLSMASDSSPGNFNHGNSLSQSLSVGLSVLGQLLIYGMQQVLLLRMIRSQVRSATHYPLLENLEEAVAAAAVETVHPPLPQLTGPLLPHDLPRHPRPLRPPRGPLDYPPDLQAAATRQPRRHPQMMHSLRQSSAAMMLASRCLFGARMSVSKTFMRRFLGF